MYGSTEWLWKPVRFFRPQADFVRGRDYSFVTDRKTGSTVLSVNTLQGRILVSYDVSPCFAEYFDRQTDSPWQFGTAKLVELKGEWYFHIPMTRDIPDTFDHTVPAHVVGIDRGLRFVANTYDETSKSCFFSGQEIRHFLLAVIPVSESIYQ